MRPLWGTTGALLGLALVVSACGYSAPAQKPLTAAGRLRKETQLLMQAQTNFQSSGCTTDHSDPATIVAWTDPTAQEEYTVTIDAQQLTWQADYAFVGGHQIESAGTVTPDLRAASFGYQQPGAATADGPHSDPTLNLACNILYYVSGQEARDLYSVQYQVCSDEFDYASAAFQACEEQLKASPSPGLGE
jgi:hypothetical protein